MLNLVHSLSDVSRTNQLKIDPSEDVAEKLFQYLYKSGKGIEFFSTKDWYTKDNSPRGKKQSDAFYRMQDKRIKQEIQRRLAEYGVDEKISNIHYFQAHKDGAKTVFFLSPNKSHSGWKQLFDEKWAEDNRERIFNLVFKFYLLSHGLPADAITGFEEIIFVHSKNLSKNKDALFVWGQSLLVKYNYHKVLTLTLSRKSLKFLPQDQYSILDGDDVGELLIHKRKTYRFAQKRDARESNSIVFMRFDSKDPDLERFHKTQLYHYHTLMGKLEKFLEECGMSFVPLNFQADCFLENPFIKNIEAVKPLQIINNTGIDLTQADQNFLQNFLKHQGVEKLSFYYNGKSISSYAEIQDGDESVWSITENVPWSDIVLEKTNNYLVFNRELNKEAGSMAYQGEDGLWFPSSDIDAEDKVDFYSYLKRRFSYIDTGEFYSTQGLNLPEFRAVKDADCDGADDFVSVLVYNQSQTKIDKARLSEDASGFTSGQFLEPDKIIIAYISGQEDSDLLKKFMEKHNVSVTPEFRKVLIELGIKSWIRESMVNPKVGLPIAVQSFSEKRFYAIYVRSPRYKDAKAVAIEFIYRDGYIYINEVVHDPKIVLNRFPFVKTRRNQPGVLTDDQEYFVDEDDQIYISCFESENFTPLLIGRPDLLQSLENRTLELDRKIKDENSSRLLPVVSYYNGEIRPFNRIKDMICFDLKNKTFIQYYVPSGKGLLQVIKRGFKVYHVIGKTYPKQGAPTTARQDIPTSELIEHPITALHFSTLTQNILKISENSQSSLLQKIAKVLVEN